MLGDDEIKILNEMLDQREKSYYGDYTSRLIDLQVHYLKNIIKIQEEILNRMKNDQDNNP